MGRRIITIVLAVMCVMTTFGLNAKAAPGNRLGMEVLRLKWDGNNNAFVSPVSLAFALGLGAGGTEGETKSEILEALEIKDAGELSKLYAPLEASGLKIANAAFVRDGLTLKDEYKALIYNAFSAEVFPLNDAELINGWVKNHTNGLIDKLIDDIPGSLMLMLTNAVAMDLKWNEPFDPFFTREETFHGANGDRDVSMMHGTFNADYAEINDLQLLRLEYKNSHMYMLIALPKDGDILRTIDWLCENDINAIPFELRSPESIIEGIIENEKRYRSEIPDALIDELKTWFDRPEKWRVSLSLPKFDLSVSQRLEDELMSLGIKKAFDPVAADFSAMSDSKLFVSGVLQKLRVQVDEDGTKAAAVTSAMMDGAAMMYDQIPVKMTCDEPFVVVIADEMSGAICFAGVVSEIGK